MTAVDFGPCAGPARNPPPEIPWDFMERRLVHALKSIRRFGFLAYFYFPDSLLPGVA